jgi:hypothetical protein
MNRSKYLNLNALGGEPELEGGERSGTRGTSCPDIPQEHNGSRRSRSLVYVEFKNAILPACDLDALL